MTPRGRRALVTGVTGQDGAYLAQFLLGRGCEVWGTVRRMPQAPSRLDALGIRSDLRLLEFDLCEPAAALRVVDRVRPDEIYNLAAQSSVGLSFREPLLTAEVDGLAVVRLLDAIRAVNPAIRVFQASTGEMFGRAPAPQSEATPFRPRSPYGVAKLYAHLMLAGYRESYGLHLSAGILFNHESPLRGLDFVTRKITRGLAGLKHGRLDVLTLGHLDATRDWGFAGDYVAGMWRMLQEPAGDDYVLATGVATSVRTFVELAAGHLGFDLAWQGSGLDEVGIDRRSGRRLVAIDPAFYRPLEADRLVGDAAKARERLGWVPATSLSALVAMMAEADERRARDGSDDTAEALVPP